MKKLLIAMTAAAVGTCAWAEGEQTLLNETFESTWTLAGNTWWTYSAGEAADGELTLADGKLSLNTGSKVLTGSFTSDDQPKAIGTDGLYFNATVTFKDPSDTLPELKDSDKFALVVLDNVESFEAEPKLATTQTTNLWVIAKYGADENVKRAYKLNINTANDGVIQNLDADWLSDDHTIVVKAYDNVMAATPNRAGFLVMVDGYVCTVDYSCAIVDGVIDFINDVKYSEKNGNPEYLGFAATDILASVRLRYTGNQLLLSMTDNNATLTSVDFQGQGVIDDVSLATTGADFGTDALVFTVEGTVGGVTITSEKTVAYAAAGETKNITFTLTNGWVLKGIAKGLEPDANGVYTYVYTTVADNNQVVKIEAFEPKAYVGDTAYETFAEALSAGGTIKLAQKVAENITIAGNKTIVLDLNGFDIEGSNASRATIVSEGNLTITNSVADKGSVVATAAGSVVNNGGVLNVQAGTFTGLVKVDGYNDEFGSADASVTVTGGTFDGAFTVVTPAEGAGYTVTATVTGGKFLKTSNASVAGVAKGYEAKEENGYWVVAPVSTSDYPESDEKVVYDENLSADEKETQKAAVELTFDAIADASDIDDADTAVKTYINTVYGNSVPADALIGAKNVDISVNFSLPLMKEDPAVKFVAEATEAGEAAAFTFQIKEGDAGDAVAIKAALAKVYEMIRYSADLNGLDAGVVDANNGNVECTISADKKSVKVSFKSGEGKPSKGFMKVKLR